MANIELTDVRKVYAGGVEAVKGVSLSIEDGQFVVLVGPSGCGKSTLLRMVAGLETISSGTVQIGDRVVNELEPAARDIAMVFQNYALYPHMTVRGNLEYGLKNRKMAAAEIARRVDEAATMLEIAPLLDRRPGQLSGGQRQRVAMGRALVRDPDVFLFDEPLSNLDAKLRVDMRTEIKKLHQKLGTTIVYVTHDQIEALTLSTRIAVMYGGYVQQLGTPKEVYDNPANMFVAGFMGSPSMNLFPAKVAVENGRAVAKITLADGGTGTLPFADGNAMAEHDGRDIILGIRPEAITDEDGADRNSNAIHRIDARVEITEPAGSDTFVVTQFGGKEVTGRFRADVDVKAGDTFPFAINMEKAVAFDPKTEERIG